MRPSLTPISAMPSRPDAGSITRPPRNSRSNWLSIGVTSHVVGAPCIVSMLTAWRPVQAEGKLMQGCAADGEGIGQSVPRLEDDRYLRGKGEFIADIRLAGMRDLAFVRSPVAHARIRCDPQARRRGGIGVRRARPRGRAADRCGVRTAGIQVIGAAGAGDRQGAACRRGDRRLRGGKPCRGGGSRRRRRDRLRRIAGTWWTCVRHSPAKRKLHEHWRQQRFPGDVRRSRTGTFRPASADRGAAAPAHGTAMHVAAGRPRRRRHLGSSARATAGL